VGLYPESEGSIGFDNRKSERIVTAAVTRMVQAEFRTMMVMALEDVVPEAGAVMPIITIRLPMMPAGVLFVQARGNRRLVPFLMMVSFTAVLRRSLVTVSIRPGHAGSGKQDRRQYDQEFDQVRFHGNLPSNLRFACLDARTADWFTPRGAFR
jgi:hypothetical protein